MIFVYILKSDSTGQFYVGHTEDLVRRTQEHEEGRSPYTKGRGPWRLVHVEVFSTRSEAMMRERYIKKRKSRKYIEALLEQSEGKWQKLVKK